jgi:hypothetical protein
VGPNDGNTSLIQRKRPKSDVSGQHVPYTTYTPTRAIRTPAMGVGVVGIDACEQRRCALVLASVLGTHAPMCTWCMVLGLKRGVTDRDSVCPYWARVTLPLVRRSEGRSANGESCCRPRPFIPRASTASSFVVRLAVRCYIEGKHGSW